MLQGRLRRAPRPRVPLLPALLPYARLLPARPLPTPPPAEPLHHRAHPTLPAPPSARAPKHRPANRQRAPTAPFRYSPPQPHAPQPPSRACAAPSAEPKAARSARRQSPRQYSDSVATCHRPSPATVPCSPAPARHPSLETRPPPAAQRSSTRRPQPSSHRRSRASATPSARGFSARAIAAGSIPADAPAKPAAGRRPTRRRSSLSAPGRLARSPPTEPIRPTPAHRSPAASPSANLLPARTQPLRSLPPSTSPRSHQPAHWLHQTLRARQTSRPAPRPEWQHLLPHSQPQRRPVQPRSQHHCLHSPPQPPSARTQAQPAWRQIPQVRTLTHQTPPKPLPQHQPTKPPMPPTHPAPARSGSLRHAAGSDRGS